LLARAAVVLRDKNSRCHSADAIGTLSAILESTHLARSWLS
jgi:hypothetical protein